MRRVAEEFIPRSSLSDRKATVIMRARMLISNDGKRAKKKKKVKKIDEVKIVLCRGSRHIIVKSF